MRFAEAVLVSWALAGMTLAQSGQVPTRPSSRAVASSVRTESSCQQDWDEMAERSRAEAGDLAQQVSGLQTLLTMLRSDAGIVSDSRAKDALQVNADMWELLIGAMQRQTMRLQELA